jgi:exopolyphosphatase / guanosine-5'-triphosphate,3'-diphosphate pyrophosphatase
VRLGVLDVGSNTVHLLVVDARRGGHPTPMSSTKATLRLAETIDSSGKITRRGADKLIATVDEFGKIAISSGCAELMAFATSAVRDAKNSDEVLARVRSKTGVELQVLRGVDESRLTFLAVRRWYGWSAGRIINLDIGGGSLELSNGVDEEPDVALSLPLGAGRLTREWLKDDPPGRRQVAMLRDWLDVELADASAKCWTPAARTLRWPRRRRPVRWHDSPARRRRPRARGRSGHLPPTASDNSYLSSLGWRRLIVQNWKE